MIIYVCSTKSVSQTSALCVLHWLSNSDWQSFVKLSYSVIDHKVHYKCIHTPIFRLRLANNENNDNQKPI